MTIWPIQSPANILGKHEALSSSFPPPEFDIGLFAGVSEASDNVSTPTLRDAVDISEISLSLRKHGYVICSEFIGYKNDIFRWKQKIYFFFTQSIDCVYTLKPSH